MKKKTRYLAHDYLSDENIFSKWKFIYSRNGVMPFCILPGKYYHWRTHLHICMHHVSTHTLGANWPIYKDLCFCLYKNHASNRISIEIFELNVWQWYMRLSYMYCIVLVHLLKICRNPLTHPKYIILSIYKSILPSYSTWLCVFFSVVCMHL